MADMNLQIQKSWLPSCLSCLPSCWNPLSFQKLFLYVAVYLLIFVLKNKAEGEQSEISTKWYQVAISNSSERAFIY